MTKRLFLLLVFYPCLVMGQTNALYTLLNWNTKEQQKSLIAWYDLQDPSTVQLAANQGVYRLNDKSIWKNHISQPNSSYQPLFITDSKLSASATVNGISFANGGYMLLKFNTTKTIQAITSFVICKNSLGGSKLLYDLGLEGGEGIASCYAGNDKIESRVPNSLAALKPNFGTNPNQYLFIATRGSAGNVQASLNESQYNGQGTRNFVGDQFNRIRLSTEPGVAPSDGNLYELILFDRKLNDDEYDKVKNFLIEKYNAQSLFLGNSKQIENEKKMTGYSQIGNCIVIPESISSSAIKYTGECKNGRADGVGTLVYNGGNKITGKFLDNKLQDGIVTFFHAKDKEIYIGPYRNGKLDGRHIKIDSLGQFVSVANMVNGSYVGNNNDYFEIPEPNEISSSNFPFFFQKSDNKYPITHSFLEIHPIPNSTLALVKTFSEENSKGGRYQFFSIYDFRTNQVIRKIGSALSPADRFLCFGDDLKTVYVVQTKMKIQGVYKVNLDDGLETFICRYDQQKIVDFSKFKAISNSFLNDKENEEGYLQLGSFDMNINGKIYVYNNYGRYDKGTSYTTFSKYSSDGRLINSLKIKNAQIETYGYHEGINQLALAYRTKDSVYISLYSLDSLKFLRVIEKNRVDKYPINSIHYSPFGKYLCVTKYTGTVIYKDDEIYYGIPKGFISFNKLENVALCNEDGGIFAYDIENRKTLWRYNFNKENKEILEKKLYTTINIDNDVLLIIGNSGGAGTHKPTIKKLNFLPPFDSQIFFSLNMDVQRQLQEISASVKAEKSQITPKTTQASGQNTINKQILKTTQFCNWRVTKPVLTYVFVDNRKQCYCCGSKYARYALDSDENIASIKNGQEIRYLEALLDKHFEDSNADEGHKLEDRKKVEEFKIRTYGVSFLNVAQSLMSKYANAFGKIFGGDNTLTSKRREIDRYNLVSKYCSTRCERDPRCY